MKKTNLLPIFVLTLSTSVPAFWGGNNNWSPFNTNSWAPFGSGTGYNSSTPWSGNSNWNPFGTSNNWSPRNDAANMSRYSGRPSSLMQYRRNPGFRPNNIALEVNDVVKPSNWLTETVFCRHFRRS